MHVTWLGHRDFAVGMQVRCGPRMGPNPRAGVFIGRRAKTQALTCNDTGPGVMCPRLRGHPRLLATRSPGDWPAEPSRPCQHLCSRLRAAHVVKGNVSAALPAPVCRVCESRPGNSQGHWGDLSRGNRGQGLVGAEAGSRAQPLLWALWCLSAQTTVQKCKPFLGIPTPPQKCFHLKYELPVKGSTCIKDLKKGC